MAQKSYGSLFRRSKPNRTPRQKNMHNAETAAITRANTGRTGEPSHRARSSAPAGALNIAAMIAKTNELRLWQTSSLYSPNQGASPSQAAENGKKVANILGNDSIWNVS